MVRWTEESNLHGVPTDCPQRDERLGWMNDLSARSEELVHNCDAYRFIEKFIDDVADAQDEATGAISDTVPYLLGKRPADPACAAYLLMPFLLHQHSRNLRLLERHYTGCRRWVDFLTSQSEGGITNYSYYGDWCPPADCCKAEGGWGAMSADTPGKLVSTGYYCYALDLLANVAGLLGREKDELKYRELFLKTRDIFHRTFWREDAAGYGSGNQASATHWRFILISYLQKIVPRLRRP